MTNNTQVGTIQWAIEVSKRLQKKAIESIETRKSGLTYMKGISPRLKFYLAIATGCEYKGMRNWGGRSSDRGYIIMSENEFKYAIGAMSEKEANEMVGGYKKVYMGRKLIVCASTCAINPRKLELIPIR